MTVIGFSVFESLDSERYDVFVEDERMKTETITGRIYAKALELLEQHPEGLRFTVLRSLIEESDRSFHPKTVNGCVWKLVERFPDKVYKPSRGLFRLVKYKTDKE